MNNFIAVAIGYLCGAIPFGLLLTQAAGLGDVRKIGSGNIGATNVLRTGNKSIAALTLLCDMLKGLIPVLIGFYLGGIQTMQWAGFAALAGHIFPVWLGFKGGKGVATTFGVLLGWSWMLALVSLGTWMIVFLIKKISSLAALVSALFSIPASYILAPPFFPAVVFLAVILSVTHRANIQRLAQGEEPQTSFSKKP